MGKVKNAQAINNLVSEILESSCIFNPNVPLGSWYRDIATKKSQIVADIFAQRVVRFALFYQYVFSGFLAQDNFDGIAFHEVVHVLTTRYEIKRYGSILPVNLDTEALAYLTKIIYGVPFYGLKDIFTSLETAYVNEGMAEYSVFIGNPNTERQNKVFLDMLNDLMTKVGVSDPLSLLFVSQPKINAAAKKMLDEVSRRRYGVDFSSVVDVSELEKYTQS